MFQLTFLRMVRPDPKESIDLVEKRLSSRFGLPPPGSLEELNMKVKQIFEVGRFDEFFRVIGVPPRSKLQACQLLRDAIRQSEVNRYHKNPHALTTLKAFRIDLEQGREPRIQLDKSKSFFPSYHKK